MSSKSEIKDGMLISWDVPLEMDDGLVLRADIYAPPEPGQYPVLLSYGPYAKGLSFQEGYPSAWQRMADQHPDVTAGSSNKYQSWEVVDPEKWVPHGYVCVRVDSRGTGRSPGYVDHFSPRETKDFYNCIEWAGVQPWSNGKVGLAGISYYAINQWHVAALQPPHLAAICPWEGAADWYRDMTHHGGILCTFWDNWYDMQVKTVQHGLGERGPVNANNGQPVAGPETLSEKDLAANRCDFGLDILEHPLDDEYHQNRSTDWSRVQVPVLSSGNWGGQGLHLRGNTEGFVRAASTQKWLEMHGLEHWTEFYTDYGRELQKKFFDYFLKGEDNGWDKQPPVQLQVRKVDGFELRYADDWPLPGTQWQRFYLDLQSQKLTSEPNPAEASLSYEALGDGLSFMSEPLEKELNLIGPLAARVFASSSTEDLDLFLTLQVFDPKGEEVVFQGAIDPHTPIAQGWLRASHRKLDRELSTEYRPYHTHDEKQPLTPGEVFPLEVELWPTCLVVPAGYRLGLSVRGSDYVYQGADGEDRLSNFKNDLTGCGPFLHNDPRDRPVETFGGTYRLHGGSDLAGYLLIPVAPLAGENS